VVDNVSHREGGVGGTQLFGVLWCQFATEGVLLAGIGIRTCGNAGTIGVLIVVEAGIIVVEAGIIGTEDEVVEVIGWVWVGKSCKSF
jgi:hypothetical protein